MNKSKRIVVGLIVATVLLTPVVGFLFADRVVPVLGPILPRPDGVPNQASATHDFKEGIVWRWRRTLRHGCASWMAMDRLATVTLARSQQGCTGEGSSLNYASFAEEVVFDWGRGDWSGGSPCPFTVSSSEIAAYLRLVREARNAADTDAERAMLMQIEQRLAKADGDKLTTDHTGGCNDLKIADYSGPLRPHLDVWIPH
ncbi:MAG TPA: hypothetical protein VKC17_03365 [Sphingomicrobium sp.]|nr:hypothetical protein [Sphingomicrobium sp.]